MHAGLVSKEVHERFQSLYDTFVLMGRPNIDKRLSTVIAELNAFEGIVTTDSCEGHPFIGKSDTLKIHCVVNKKGAEKLFGIFDTLNNILDTFGPQHRLNGFRGAVTLELRRRTRMVEFRDPVRVTEWVLQIPVASSEEKDEFIPLLLEAIRT